MDLIAPPEPPHALTRPTAVRPPRSPGRRNCGRHIRPMARPFPYRSMTNSARRVSLGQWGQSPRYGDPPPAPLLGCAHGLDPTLRRARTAASEPLAGAKRRLLAARGRVADRPGPGLHRRRNGRGRRAEDRARSDPGAGRRRFSGARRGHGGVDHRRRLRRPRLAAEPAQRRPRVARSAPW